MFLIFYIFLTVLYWKEVVDPVPLWTAWLLFSIGKLVLNEEQGYFMTLLFVPNRKMRR
jgi:hypothetical protein